MVQIIQLKQLKQLSVVAVICACASFVATLFLNFWLDLRLLDFDQLSLLGQAYYRVQEKISQVVAGVSGLVLVATALAMVLFYIHQFIEDHQTDLGILKAMGYARGQLARQFWIFGLYGLLGTLLGGLAAYTFLPHFYTTRNSAGLLTGLSLHLHWGLVLTMVLLTSLLLTAMAVGYAYHVLARPSLVLLKGSQTLRPPRKKGPQGGRENFLSDLRASLFWRHKFLIFLVGFAAFCIAAMLQLALSLQDMMDVALQVMMIGIGLILSLSIFYLALLTLLSRHKDSVAILKAMGYSQRDCLSVTLRPYYGVVMLGFLLGSVYQFCIMRLILWLVVGQGSQMVDSGFNWVNFVLAGFLLVIVYTGFNVYFSRRLAQVPIKAILLSE